MHRRRGDDGRAVPVAYIVLDNKYRPDAALLAADHRAEVGVVDVAAFDVVVHDLSHSDEKYFRSG